MTTQKAKNKFLSEIECRIDPNSDGVAENNSGNELDEDDEWGTKKMINEKINKYGWKKIFCEPITTSLISPETT